MHKDPDLFIVLSLPVHEEIMQFVKGYIFTRF